MTTTSSGRVHGIRQLWRLWISSLTLDSRWTCTEWSPLTLRRCRLMVLGRLLCTVDHYVVRHTNIQVFLPGTEFYWDDPRKVGSKVSMSDGSFYYRGPGLGTSSFLAHNRLKSRNFIKGDNAFFLFSLEGTETDRSLSARLYSSLAHVTVLLFLRHICFAGISVLCSCSCPCWWWSEEVCNTGTSTGYCYTCCGRHCCCRLCGGCGSCSHANHQETEETAGGWSHSHHTGHAWVHGGKLQFVLYAFVKPFGVIQTQCPWWITGIPIPGVPICCEYLRCCLSTFLYKEPVFKLAFSDHCWCSGAEDCCSLMLLNFGFMRCSIKNDSDFSSSVFMRRKQHQSIHPVLWMWRLMPTATYFCLTQVLMLTLTTQEK